eukprot:CAMPEP_0185795870 /NCGR_PEP_ID=MMETSP1174-20130828/160777_1 /TAXON_ID=35687 /ORGANISM="Dictyocha speculum, Strain CCMP1381" /LENGTH=453 /DNA_ID=CAMNT_0028491191 /DNA_START=38 /DNA_END=1399 /DNA_ORIENTATION=-
MKNKFFCGDTVAALALLGSDPSELAHHAGDVVQLLTDPNENVRCAAADSLVALEASALAPHASGLVDCLNHRNPAVSTTAAAALLHFAKTASSEARERNHANVVCQFRSKRGDSLLHLAARFGWSEVAASIATQFRARLTDVANCDAETALHVAAREGHLDICLVLVGCGARENPRNIRGHVPLTIAKKHGHDRVVEFLASRANLETVRGGTGDAFDEAMRDNRAVLAVVWHTIPLPGRLAKGVGAFHSLLAITVGEKEESSHTYVLEKAAVDRSERIDGDDNDDADDNEGKNRPLNGVLNGVHISHWHEVANNVVNLPRAELTGEDVAGHFDATEDDKGGQGSTSTSTITMRSLRAIALATGPYDLVSSNCHHAALRVFNACAVPNRRQRTIPNLMHVKLAGTLRHIGIDVARSGQSRSFNSALPPPASPPPNVYGATTRGQALVIETSVLV